MLLSLEEAAKRADLTLEELQDEANVAFRTAIGFPQ